MKSVRLKGTIHISMAQKGSPKKCNKHVVPNSSKHLGATIFSFYKFPAICIRLRGQSCSQALGKDVLGDDVLARTSLKIYQSMRNTVKHNTVAYSKIN